jgi:hypothetical protein
MIGWHLLPLLVQQVVNAMTEIFVAKKTIQKSGTCAQLTPFQGQGARVHQLVVAHTAD